MQEAIHQELIRRKPTTLVILGSGIQGFKDALEDVVTYDYERVFDLSTDQSIGHAGQLHAGVYQGVSLLVMEGRKHYYEGTTEADMRLAIQTLVPFGLKRLIVTNACGGMNPSFRPGDIMVIDDHINLMGRNPLIGANRNDLGERFVDMSEPYDLTYRHLADELAKAEAIELQHGVYVSYLGPSYETKAEIKAFRMLGGDAVGMSTVPEVIVARHAGLRVLGLSLITNMATGITDQPLSHHEVLEVGKNASKKLVRLMLLLVERMNHE